MDGHWAQRGGAEEEGDTCFAQAQLGWGAGVEESQEHVRWVRGCGDLSRGEAGLLLHKGPAAEIYGKVGVRVKVRIEWEALCSGVEWPWGDQETRGRAAARRLLSWGLACKVPAGAGETCAALTLSQRRRVALRCGLAVL